MDNGYMVGRESLTEEEGLVLRLIKEVGKPIGEHEFHMMMSITESVLGDGLYQFQPNVWEHIDERYETGLGNVPYSQRLHEVIDSLVAKHYLTRDSERPIVIFEDRQLRLF